MAWIADMNGVLAGVATRQAIVGVVRDPDSATTAEKAALVTTMAEQRSAQGLPSAFPIAVTFGADSLGVALGWLAADSPYPLDQAWLEVYNIYTDTIPARYDAPPTSPPSTDTIYTQHRNDPAGGLAALTALLQASPNFWQKKAFDAETAARLHLLFSIEHVDGRPCLYPNASNALCGQIDAFGTWQLAEVLAFLSVFAGGQGALLPSGAAVPAANLGVFQYTFLPPAP
jgi:hypothetical protein